MNNDIEVNIEDNLKAALCYFNLHCMYLCAAAVARVHAQFARQEGIHVGLLRFNRCA